MTDAPHPAPALSLPLSFVPWPDGGCEFEDADRQEIAPDTMIALASIAIRLASLTAEQVARKCNPKIDELDVIDYARAITTVANVMAAVRALAAPESAK